MDVPNQLFYTKEHEWVDFSEDLAVMGITDYAQDALGDITFVDLPEKNSEVEQFEQCVSVESVKAASDIYAPASGIIIDVNQELENAPELVNHSCYKKGWMVKIKVSNVNEKEKLMSAKEYHTYVESLDEQ